MVRVWLRPALAALRRQAAPNAYAHVALKAASQQTPSLVAARGFSSKKGKKTLHDKFVDVEDDLTEIPPEIEYLNKEALKYEDELDPELIAAIEAADIGGSDSDSDDVHESDDEEEEDSDDEVDQLEKLLEGQDIDEDALLDEEDEEFEGLGLSDAELATKYERQLSKIRLSGGGAVEDDRVYIEMPYFDPMLSLMDEGDFEEEGEEIEGGDEGDDDEDGEDEDFDEDEEEDDDDDDDDGENTVSDFEDWNQGVAYSPEMLNWMVPSNKRKPFTDGKKEKPWKYFVRANHPDPVELALDVDLLRLFISPTGRIRPRRFTGLTAKQQRLLARSIKISRQLALLPYLSRYPDPSPEQWRAMNDAEVARLLAEAEANGGIDDDDDDDDEDMEDMEEE